MHRIYSVLAAALSNSPTLSDFAGNVIMTYIVHAMYKQTARRTRMARKQAKIEKEPSSKVERLGFRVDGYTKELIERAAHLERRKLTDFCLAALTDAARRTITQHETLVLSERDRQIFFDVLINPPAINERLKRALVAHRRRLSS
jgi:uncharacterized protein (DUF1778 family)